MKTLLIMSGVIVLWIALQAYILPKMGISTWMRKSCQLADPKDPNPDKSEKCLKWAKVPKMPKVMVTSSAYIVWSVRCGKSRITRDWNQTTWKSWITIYSSESLYTKGFTDMTKNSFAIFARTLQLKNFTTKVLKPA